MDATPHVPPTDDDEVRARELVASLTLEEKASLTSGRDFWTTQPIERAGVPGVTLTDGPHGVRLEAGDPGVLGLHGAVPATCFPTASALAATWDASLLRTVGEAIGLECLELGVGVLLGPGVNVKRSPLCGRNFEYLSEDPFLGGSLAAAFIQGVQSRGVGTALKHFAGNDQEQQRMTIDAVYDERTLRELELAAFEIAVTTGEPWTVMGSYNRLNGTYACQDPWLLTDVLRTEWGFRGVVMTDWGAMDERVAALAAGCDLEMPGGTTDSDRHVVEGVRAGMLEEGVLDAAATRLVALALRAERHRRTTTFSRDEHHHLARRVAGEAAVLLRNEGALPIAGDGSVALIGPFAVDPRFQGTGSSRINPTRVETLLVELRALLGPERVTHAMGVDRPDLPNDGLVAAAVATAIAADVAVVCVGLPDGYENEGNDRSHLRLPRSHDALVAAIAAVHPRVVVVLSNGAPVEMPWLEDVDAVVEGYLGGQAGGGGLADVLTGAVDPSGRLAETFPRHIDDVPAHRNFPGGPTTVEHREGLYVGYRFHDTVADDVLFCFGHGLSYTTFELGTPAVDRTEVSVEDLERDGVAVDVEVANTGDRAGATVVQLYVRDVEAAVYRPDRELKGFSKVRLEAGGSTSVRLHLPARAFSYWHPDRADWTIEPGAFELHVGFSSRDLRGSASVRVVGDPLETREEPVVYRRPARYLDVDGASYAALLGRPVPPNPPIGRPFDRNTPIGATAGTAFGRILVPLVERRLRAQFGDDPANDALVTSMVEDAPLRTLLMGGVTEEQLDGIVDLVNGRWGSGANRIVQVLRSSLDRS